jgi:hypothetical protein
MQNNPQDQVLSQSVAQHTALLPIHNYHISQSVDQYLVRGQPNEQYQPPPQSSEDGQDFYGESGLGDDLANDYID